MQKEHYEVLLESIDSKMQLALEEDTAMDRKIDTVRDNLAERIDLVDAKVDIVDKKIDAVEERLTARIDSVEVQLIAKIDAVAHDLAAHRAGTEAHHTIYRVGEY